MASALYTDVKRKGDRSVFTRSRRALPSVTGLLPASSSSRRGIEKLVLATLQAAGGTVWAEGVGGGGLRARPCPGHAGGQPTV